MILADTNILLRSLHPEHPRYEVAKEALKTLRLGGETLCIAPQNLVEFWAVATRPLNENGLGMAAERVANEIAILRRLFRLLPYVPEVLDVWQNIVAGQLVIGKQTHDAHLVAIMQVHLVSTILTFNTSHFERFPGITILDPEHV